MYETIADIFKLRFPNRSEMKTLKTLLVSLEVFYDVTQSVSKADSTISEAIYCLRFAKAKLSR